MPEPTFGYEAEEVFPIERPEGIPQGVEECVIDSWYPKERGLKKNGNISISRAYSNGTCRDEK